MGSGGKRRRKGRDNVLARGLFGYDIHSIAGLERVKVVVLYLLAPVSVSVHGARVTLHLLAPVSASAHGARVKLHKFYQYFERAS